jgi:hypothetical protein
MSGILPAERAIIDLLHANANEYVTLSSDIAGSTTYVVNNIQIVNRKMEKNEKLVTFVKAVEQKKNQNKKLLWRMEIIMGFYIIYLTQNILLF